MHINHSAALLELEKFKHQTNLMFTCTYIHLLNYVATESNTVIFFFQLIFVLQLIGSCSEGIIQGIVIYCIWLRWPNSSFPSAPKTIVIISTTISISLHKWDDTVNVLPSFDLRIGIVHVSILTCLRRANSFKGYLKELEKVPDPRWWLLAVSAYTFHFLVQMLDANSYLLLRLNPTTHILPDSAQTLFLSPPISSHSKGETSL